MLRFGQLSHSERKQSLRGTARVASTNLRRDGDDNNGWELPVIDDHTQTPPSDPEVGDRYIIPCGATGDWFERTGQIAEWVGNAWRYTTPSPGATIWVLTRNYLTTFAEIPGVEGPDADIDIDTWLPHHLIDASHTIYPGQVADRATTPPVSPDLYALYIVTATATGAWAGHENEIAISVCNALTHTRSWAFIHAQEGDVVWVMDENLYYIFDGSVWKPLHLYVLNLGVINDLSDVSGTPTLNYVLTWNGTGWVPAITQLAPHSLNQHTDTNFPSPSNGQVVTWDAGTSRWIASTPTAVSHTLGVPHSNVDDSVDSAPSGYYLGTYGTGVWKELPFPSIPPEFDPGDLQDQIDDLDDRVTVLEGGGGGGDIVCGVIVVDSGWQVYSGSGFTVSDTAGCTITFDSSKTVAWGVADDGEMKYKVLPASTTWVPNFGGTPTAFAFTAQP